MKHFAFQSRNSYYMLLNNIYVYKPTFLREGGVIDSIEKWESANHP
jgi:hypothetical protein